MLHKKFKTAIKLVDFFAIAFAICGFHALLAMVSSGDAFQILDSAMKLLFFTGVSFVWIFYLRPVFNSSILRMEEDYIIRSVSAEQLKTEDDIKFYTNLRR